MSMDLLEKKLQDAGFTLASVSRSQASRAWGFTEGKARHILAKLRSGSPAIARAAGSTVTGKPVKTECVEITDKELKYELPRTRINTLEELISQFKVDTAKWKVERFICNSWEVGAKIGEELVTSPLYQVKATFVRKDGWDVESIKAEVERIKEDAKREIKPFNINKRYPHNRKATNALEVSIEDLHLGKLSWSPEAGGASYELKIAQRVGEQAFVDLINRTDRSSLGKILLVIGNDFIHSDNIQGTTTRGTQVNSDGRYHKLFQAGYEMAKRQIETCLQIAPVDVVTCVGNHDTHISYGISHSLDSLYSGNKHVSFDNGPALRKYWNHGNTLIMFTHGSDEKHKDLPMIMATESPRLFGECEYKECHTGHLHQVREMEHRLNTVEQFGVRVRILPSLTPPDAWHSKCGYIGNVRAAQSFLWSKYDGLLTINEYNVKRLHE